MAVALVRSDILYAWKGPSLLIVSMRSECSREHPLSGFYFREARFLRTLRVATDGERPWLSETASLDPESLAMNFVHPEIKSPGGGGTGSQRTEAPTDGRANSLYFPVADDGGERGRNSTGHVRRTSVYTKAALHPAAMAVVLGALATVALTVATRPRRIPDEATPAFTRVVAMSGEDRDAEGSDRPTTPQQWPWPASDLGSRPASGRMTR